ncbi:MAG: heme exporter protein CcmD [Pseudomonadota bacterium]|nr:heme exporter protein CcmD [Pseudomonadota bacterium]
MAEFFYMGGYAFYVWSAFGISFFALSLLYWFSKKNLKKALLSTQLFLKNSNRGAQ